jgi:hypothetical protein
MPIASAGWSNSSLPSVALVGINACNNCTAITSKPDNSTFPCANFTFFIALDEFPEDVSYKLTGPNRTIWDQSPWSQENRGQIFTDSTCLDVTSCYNFTILDSSDYPNGLTDASENGQPGSFVLLLDDTPFGAYDGNVDGCYESKWYQFGDGCDFAMGGNAGANCTTAARPCTDFVFNITLDE